MQQTVHVHPQFQAALSTDMTADWFDPAWWAQQGKITGAQTGRAQTWFVDDDSEKMVLRHYTRGGLAARLSRDRYLWTGLQRSRPWSEWQLTDELFRRGLPVPFPIAFRIQRAGFFYRADLLTRQIENCQTLHDLIVIMMRNEISESLFQQILQQIGKTIEQFHAQQLFHADLNVRNILVQHSEDEVQRKIFLIDFDRCDFRKGDSWKAENLARLRRSVQKSTQDVQKTDQIMHAIAD